MGEGPSPGGFRQYVFPLEADRASPLPSLAVAGTSPPRQAISAKPIISDTPVPPSAGPPASPAVPSTSAAPSILGAPSAETAPSATKPPVPPIAAVASAKQAVPTKSASSPQLSVASTDTSMAGGGRRRRGAKGRRGGGGESASSAPSPAPAAAVPAAIQAKPDPATVARLAAVESRISTLQGHVGAAKSIACNAEARVGRFHAELRTMPGIVASRVETRIAAVEKGKKEVLERMERIETGSVKVASHVGSSVKALEGMQTKLQEIESKVMRLAAAAAASEKQTRAKEQDAAQGRDVMQTYDREAALRAELEEVRKDMKAMRILFEAQHRQQTSRQDMLEQRLLALEKVQDQQVREPSHLITRYQSANGSDMGRRTNANPVPKSPSKLRHPLPPRPDNPEQRQHRLQHLDSLMKRVAQQAASPANDEQGQEGAPLESQVEQSSEAAEQVAKSPAPPVQEVPDAVPAGNVEIEVNDDEPSTKPVDMDHLTTKINRWRIGAGGVGNPAVAPSQLFPSWSPTPIAGPGLSPREVEHPQESVTQQRIVSNAAQRAREALQAGWHASPPRRQSSVDAQHSPSRSVKATSACTSGPQPAVLGRSPASDRRGSNKSALPVTPTTPQPTLPPPSARTSAFDTFVHPYIAHRDPALAAAVPALSAGQNRFSIMQSMGESTGSFSAGQYRDPASPASLRKERIRAETVVESDAGEINTVVGHEQGDETVEVGRGNGGAAVQESDLMDMDDFEGEANSDSSTHVAIGRGNGTNAPPGSLLESPPAISRDSISSFDPHYSPHSYGWPGPPAFAGSLAGSQDPRSAVSPSPLTGIEPSPVADQAAHHPGGGGERVKVPASVQYDEEVMPGRWIPELFSNPSGMTGSTGQRHR